MWHWGADPVNITLRARAKGLPRIDVIGLCAARAKESLARLRSAFDASGLRWPRCPVVIELDGSPSGGPEPLLDLPLGVVIAAASQEAPIADVLGLAMAGEVGLDGRLQPTRGMLLCAEAMRWGGCRQSDGLCLPTEATQWLSACPAWMLYPRAPSERREYQYGATDADSWHGVFVSPSLSDVVNGQLCQVIAEPTQSLPATARPYSRDAEPGAVATIVVRNPVIPARPPLQSGWDEIVGQDAVKRAVLVALAGGHSALLWGPPGCGKSRLVFGAHALLPATKGAEARAIYLAGSGVSMEPPTVRPCSILAPGSRPEATAGEPRHATLHREAEWWAHATGGIAGIDEVDRAPDTVISTVMARLDFIEHSCEGELATRPIFLATTNERPHDQRCRIPAGLLDRLDLVIGVAAVAPEAALSSRGIVSAEALASVLAAARERQLARGGLNSHACRATLSRSFPAKSEASMLLKAAGQDRRLSVRALDAVRRVALTVADVDGEVPGDPRHILEALTWRWSMPEGYSGKPGAKPRRMAFSQQARGSTNCKR